VCALVAIAPLIQGVTFIAFQIYLQINDFPGARSGQLPFLGSTAGTDVSVSAISA
jgi:hypothetical protein